MSRYGDLPSGERDSSGPVFDDGGKCLGENIADAGGLVRICALWDYLKGSQFHVPTAKGTTKKSQNDNGPAGACLRGIPRTYIMARSLYDFLREALPAKQPRATTFMPRNQSPEHAPDLAFCASRDLRHTPKPPKPLNPKRTHENP